MSPTLIATYARTTVLCLLAVADQQTRGSNPQPQGKQELKLGSDTNRPLKARCQCFDANFGTPLFLIGLSQVLSKIKA